MKLTVRIWTLDAPAGLLHEIRRRIATEPAEFFLYPHDASLGSCRWVFPYDHPDSRELDRLLATHPVPAKVHRFRQRTYTKSEVEAAPLASGAWGGSPTNHLLVSQRVRQHVLAHRLLKPGCFDPVHISGVFDPPPDGG